MKKNTSLFEAESFQSYTGFGVTGEIEGAAVVIGNSALLWENKVELNGQEATVDRLAAAGKTPVFVVVNGKLAGVIAVADTVKSSAAGAISGMMIHIRPG